MNHLLGWSASGCKINKNPIANQKLRDKNCQPRAGKRLVVYPLSIR